MGNIVQGRGREANIARGEAECYICLETMPTCTVVHERKRYSNWLIVACTHTEHYFSTIFPPVVLHVY